MYSYLNVRIWVWVFKAVASISIMVAPPFMHGYFFTENCNCRQKCVVASADSSFISLRGHLFWSTTPTMQQRSGKNNTKYSLLPILLHFLSKDYLLDLFIIRFLRNVEILQDTYRMFMLGPLITYKLDMLLPTYSQKCGQNEVKCVNFNFLKL